MLPIQADLRLKSVGLVQRSAAVWRCSAFIAWTGWILAMTVTESWWQHHKHYPGIIIIIIIIIIINIIVIRVIILHWIDNSLRQNYTHTLKQKTHDSHDFQRWPMEVKRGQIWQPFLRPENRVRTARKLRPNYMADFGSACASVRLALLLSKKTVSVGIGSAAVVQI